MSTKIDEIYDGIQAYLTEALASAVAERNGDESDLSLPVVAEFDRGYKDVALGIRNYPAVLMLETSRRPADAYYSTYGLAVSVALRSSNIRQLERWGRAYTDILEDALLADCHLGGTCLDSSNIRITTGETSNVYLIMAEFDIDVDRGGS